MTTPDYLIDRPSEQDAMTRAWLPWALGRVDNIATLTEPATEAAATVARALLHLISALHTVAPQVAPQPLPDGQGGISIAWREHGYSLDLDIEPDGRIGGWLHRQADKAEVTWGDAESTEVA
jgi:hypothetical protein